MARSPTRRPAIEWTGFEALENALRLLPERAQERVVRPSMRAAARYIANRIKAATPVGEKGDLKRAGGFVRQSRAPNRFGVAFRIGFRRKGGAHALLVDKGTGARATRSGANRGTMPASPFFDAAVAAANSAAKALLQSTWGRKLLEEARRFRAGQLDARGRIRTPFRGR